MWERISNHGCFSERSLERTIAPLGALLVPGSRVLDVGCGPGPLTLSVAAAGPDLTVYGIDLEAAMVARAVDLARREELEVRFQRGDAYALPFRSGSFDVVFSNALLPWLTAPVRALAEQRRVARPGGSVFARMPDLAAQVVDPPCPAVAAIIHAYQGLRDSRDPEAFWNPFQGGEALSLFTEAGLIDVEIEAWSDRREACDAAPLEPSHILPFWIAEDSSLHEPFRRELERQGRIDADLLRTAGEEIRRWLRTPSAVVIRSGVYVTARAPDDSGV